MSVEAYLDETEPAVKYLFKGLDLYESIRPPSIMKYIDDTGHLKWSEKEADEMVQLSSEFLALEYSSSILAGSILQVAYVGIDLFSSNQTITPQCQAFGVEPGVKATKFCIGWTVHDIPVGLLIYSGRNQYNHWEDGEHLHKVPKKVFRHLLYAHLDNLWFDMAYELEFPSKRPVSHYIVRNELKWRTYNNYLEQMKAMLLHD